MKLNDTPITSVKVYSINLTPVNVIHPVASHPDKFHSLLSPKISSLLSFFAHRSVAISLTLKLVFFFFQNSAKSFSSFIYHLILSDCLVLYRLYSSVHKTFDHFLPTTMYLLISRSHYIKVCIHFVYFVYTLNIHLSREYPIFNPKNWGTSSTDEEELLSSIATLLPPLGRVPTLWANFT